MARLYACMGSRIHNVWGEESINILYTLYSRSSESNVTPILHMWLSQGAKRLIFLQTMKSGGGFLIFFVMDSTQNLMYHALQTFSLDIVYSKPCSQLNIWIACSHWSVLEFLVCDFALSFTCTRSHTHNQLFKSHALIDQCLNSLHKTIQKHLTQSIQYGSVKS